MQAMNLDDRALGHHVGDNVQVASASVYPEELLMPEPQRLLALLAVWRCWLSDDGMMRADTAVLIGC